MKLLKLPKKALMQTVDVLKTEFKIYSWDFLPYEAIAIVLSYIFSKRKTLNLDDVRRVRQWFWQSSFSERYRGASESFVTQDLEAIDSFVINGEEPKKPFGQIPTIETFKRLAFRSNNSRSRGLIILLALRNPRNLTNGAIIDTENALSHYNKKQFHHIYPKAYLKRISASGEHNSLANFCMLAASENNIISDDDPNDYLPKLIDQLEDETISVFKSNYLPSPQDVDYSTLEYLDFIHLRAELILADLNKLIAGSNA